GREIDKLDLFDLKPRKPRSGGVRLAGKPPRRLPPIVVTPDKPPKPDKPGIGHNGGPALEDPPQIPRSPPKQSKQRTAVQREIASWIETALSFKRHALVASFRAAIEAVSWLRQYFAQIETYRDPPKTLRELQQAVGSPRAGTQVHHRAEKEAMALSGFTQAEINAPENLVRVPTLKHYEITGWYQQPNEEFGGKTPREYLADKPLAERLRVGNDALIRFGVLKP
ncbi:MAG: hypothetical protein JWR73_2635, partial [Tardiphaga sp.]|nr:hypothetical protein [Tardiphaga sp.]